MQAAPDGARFFPTGPKRAAPAAQRHSAASAQADAGRVGRSRAGGISNYTGYCGG
jgi:hypothetical protein